MMQEGAGAIDELYVWQMASFASAGVTGPRASFSIADLKRGIRRGGGSPPAQLKELLEGYASSWRNDRAAPKRQRPIERMRCRDHEPQPAVATLDRMSNSSIIASA